MKIDKDNRANTIIRQARANTIIRQARVVLDPGLPRENELSKYLISSKIMFMQSIN